MIAIVTVFMVPPVLASNTSTHTSAELDTSGAVLAYLDMTADDQGNLRLDTYKATSASTSGSKGRGALDSTTVYLAAERKVIMKIDDECQFFGDEVGGPGMPTVSADEFATQYGQIQDEIAAAQPEIDAALAEIAKEDPAMAAMLKDQMAAMAGVGDPLPQPRYEVVNTGDKGSHGGFDTVRFDVMNLAAQERQFTIWATRVDNVDGGRRVSSGMRGMIDALETFMARLGIPSTGGGITGAMLDEMGTDWYPVRTEDHKYGKITNLIDASAPGNADFDLDCG